MPHILIMLSGATRMPLTDGRSRDIGFWPEEVIEPLGLFARGGAQFTFATPDARPAAPEPSGLTPEGTGLSPERCHTLRQEVTALEGRLNTPAALRDLSSEPFDAVFIPGGYAPMVDLWADPHGGRLLTDFHHRDKPIAAVCHGPAALLACMASSGQWPFAGYRMTAFTDDEEHGVGLLSTLPWTAQQALTKRGAHFLAASQPWQTHVVEDRNLFTGQNPASAGPLAQRLLDRLTPSR
ncbi:type 1 glutamine amidotransferase domain-containing protein [Streptomyces sp. NPDC018045]|uniref:type 1 glutamine amidotransferase domain-containing protein n=1 Tax=Streptomyces sp. NPDC018045 TaxID=3365037 RepID=UPI0037BD28D3